MPRDANGNYTLPAGNPVVGGEVISTGWANPTMSDIAAEVTNSLDRQGRGGMLAPFKFLDGTSGLPGLTWTNEPTSGFYRAGASDMRATVAGVQRMRWTSTGVEVWDPLANAGVGAWYALVSGTGINTALLNAAQTFSAAQIFSAAVAFNAAVNFTATITVSGAAPLIVFRETDQAANEQYWRQTVSAKVFALRTITDDGLTTRDFLAATRGAGAAIAAVVYGNATDNPTHTFHGAVSATSLAGAVAATTLSASGAVSGVGFSNYFASPPDIGGTAPAAGAFTTLSATGAVSGAGFIARFASPGPIGSTAASTGAFTAITASTTLGVTGAATFASTGAFTGVLSALSTLELGHATDTTLSRLAAGRIAVEGIELARLNAVQTFASVQTFSSAPVFSAGAEIGHATDTTLSRIAAGRLAMEGVEIGFRQIPRSTTATTAAVADVGKCIALSAGMTIPASTFAAGDAITLYNNTAGNLTITQGASLTLRHAGTANTGNRTLAQRGICTIWFNSATEAVISGAGLT